VRRGDVVAVGSEDDERIADASEIDRAAFADPDLAGFELVAHEEVLDRRQDLVALEHVEAVPPAFELQEALALRIEMREEVGVLVPQRALGLQAFEVLDQPGAVEPSVPEVRQEMSQPCAAREARMCSGRLGGASTPGNVPPDPPSVALRPQRPMATP
jgi:hypothetical protein